MKKTVLIMMVLVACFALASVSSAEVIIGAGGSSIGGSQFMPSTNVGIRAIASGVSYCAVAQNSSSDAGKGGRQYGTTSGSSTLKSATSTSTAAVPTSEGTACTDESTLDTSFI